MFRTDLIESVPRLLRRHACERRDKIAYSDDQVSITYADLDRSTANLAGHFRERGIGPGETVAIMLPSSVAWIQSCFATVRAGGIAVPINYDAPEPEVAYRLADAGCGLVVTTDDRADLVRQVAGGRDIEMILADRPGCAPQAGTRLSELVSSASAPAAPDADAIRDPSFMIYTPGPTGQARGVLLSQHGLLWVTAACWADRLGLTERDVFLSTVPLFHSYALNVSVMSVLALGASVHLCEKFSMQETLKHLETGRFTFFPGVPTQFQYILNATKDAPAKFPNLRLCISGGAPMAPDVKKTFEERFNVPLLEGYGITETSTFITMNAPAGGQVSGSCGIPFAGLAVRVVDPESGRDLPPGREGEIIVRGPTVMCGYHNKTDETAEALRDGWYRTGDLGVSDENTFLTITGRLKSVIIRGGQNISPAEIEDAALLFEGVSECAAFGIPHSELGEVPILFVVAKSDGAVSADELLAHCRSRLSSYKVPQAVHFVTRIPRTASGAIIRNQLRALLAEAEQAAHSRRLSPEQKDQIGRSS